MWIYFENYLTRDIWYCSEIGWSPQAAFDRAFSVDDWCSFPFLRLSDIDNLGSNHSIVVPETNGKLAWNFFIIANRRKLLPLKLITFFSHQLKPTKGNATKDWGNAYYRHQRYQDTDWCIHFNLCLSHLLKLDSIKHNL